jgi:ABC-type transport system substrate-binding protein
LVPDAAQDLPEISKDGKTYTFKIKKGIYFTPDEVFKGHCVGDIVIRVHGVKFRVKRVGHYSRRQMIE